MIVKLVKIDKILCDVAERVGHIIQMKTGIRPMQVALLGDVIVLCSALWACLSTSFLVKLAGGTVAISVSMYIFKKYLKDDVTALEHETLPRTDPMEIAYRVLNLLFLGVFGVLVFLEYCAWYFSQTILEPSAKPLFVGGLGFTIARYFNACNPLRSLTSEKTQ